MPTLPTPALRRLLGSLALLFTTLVYLAFANSDVTIVRRCLTYEDAEALDIAFENDDEDTSFNLVSCDSDSTWSPCPGAPCGVGTASRKLFCVNASLTSITTADLTSGCPEVGPQTSRFCVSADKCAGGFEWQCARLGSSDSNIGSVTWASCDDTVVAFENIACAASCGSAEKHRAARCALKAVDVENVTATTAYFTHNTNHYVRDVSPCLLTAPAPVLMEACSVGTYCNAPIWRCRDPTDPSSSWRSCAKNNGTYGYAQCQTFRCHERNSSTTRQVACIENGSFPVPDSKCAADGDKPASVRQCERDNGDCYLVSTTSDKCMSNNTAVTCTPNGDYATTTAKCYSSTLWRQVPDALCGSGYTCSLPQCSDEASFLSFRFILSSNNNCPTKKQYELESSSFSNYDCVANKISSAGDFYFDHSVCLRHNVTVPANASFTKCTYTSPATKCLNGATTVPIMRPDGIGRLAKYGTRCECAGLWAGVNCTMSVNVTVDSTTNMWVSDQFLRYYVNYYDDYTSEDDSEEDDYYFDSAYASSQRPNNMHTVIVTLLSQNNTADIVLDRYEPNYNEASAGYYYTPQKPIPAAVMGKTYKHQLSLAKKPQMVSISNDTITFERHCPDDCHGFTCNQATGLCECPGDYSGTACEFSPCETIKCNIGGAAACFVDFFTQRATCKCKSDINGTMLFTGARCDKPVADCNADGSKPACANSGFYGARSNGTDPVVCGDTCMCTNGWVGATCEKCSKVCHNSGTVSSSCDKCKCKPGFSPETDCRCRYVTIGFSALRTSLTEKWLTSSSDLSSAAVTTGLGKWVAGEGAVLTDLMKMSFTVVAARVKSVAAKKFKLELDISHADSCSIGWMTPRPADNTAVEDLQLGTTNIFPLSLTGPAQPTRFSPAAGGAGGLTSKARSLMMMSAAEAMSAAVSKVKADAAQRGEMLTLAEVQAARTQVLAERKAARATARNSKRQNKINMQQSKAHFKTLSVASAAAAKRGFRTQAVSGFGGSVATVYAGLRNLRDAFAGTTTAMADSGADKTLDASAGLSIADDAAEAGDGLPESVDASGSKDYTETIILATVIGGVGLIVIIVFIVAYCNKMCCFGKSGKVGVEGAAGEPVDMHDNGHTHNDTPRGEVQMAAV